MADDSTRRRPGPAWPQPTYVLDRASVRAVDAAAVDEYGMPGIVLMENAARALHRVALEMISGGDVVLVVAGSGNNGGDGWALARHLHNAGARPVVAPLGEPKPGTDAGVNCAISRAMGVEEIAIDDRDRCGDAALIVDAVFGTGLTRPVTGPAAETLAWINAAGRPVLAVDVPSGLDCDTGAVLGVAVRAARTVTFVGTKPGFLLPAAQPYVGEVVIGDIGAPAELTRRFGRRLE